MKMLGLFFIPDAALPLILALAGIFMIVGARQLATSLIVFVLVSLLLPPLILPFVDMVPIWVLWIVIGYLIFLLPFFAVSFLRVLLTPALGKRTAEDMGGHLAYDLVKLLLLAPFHVLGFLVRTVFRIFHRR